MSLRPNTKIDARRHGFKNPINTEEGRRRREQDLVQIRRNRREQSLNKKRRIGVDAMGVGNVLMILQAAVAGVYSDDVNEQLQATTGLRKLVSSDNPSIREVLQSGALSRVVQLLGNNDSPTLQHEAAWLLTNIASGESEGAVAVIGHGAVPMFVRLLGSPHVTVRHQNPILTSSSCRFLVHAGCIRPICSLLGCEDPFAIYSCLVALENILRAGEEEKKGINVYAQMVSQAGGAEKLEMKLCVPHESPTVIRTFYDLNRTFLMSCTQASFLCTISRMGAQQQDGSNEVLVEVEEGLAEAHRGPEFELISCFWCLECATSSLVLELKCRYLSAYVHIRDEKYYVQSWSLYHLFNFYCHYMVEFHRIVCMQRISGIQVKQYQGSSDMISLHAFRSACQPQAIPSCL
ncbi:Importin subunit alpha-1a-like protein [Drosera capensis]